MDFVVLDPAHGGSSARGSSSSDGARLGDGRMEKQVSWALAQEVARHLGGAALTRREHENRSLGERIAAARAAEAKAFVSLHASPAATPAVWVHPRAGRPSFELAESIRRHLEPACGDAKVLRGDLAVLHPDHHARSTAACLVEVGMGGGTRAFGGAAAAVARGVRGHFGRIPGRGLDVAEPILQGSFFEIVSTLADWIRRQVTWRAGVPDTTSFPFSAICKLSFTDEDGGSWGGTGFYISPTRILTAAHNIIDVNPTVNRLSRTVRMTITPGLNGTAEPFGHFEVNDRSAFVEHPSWINPDGSENESFDLGVIRVPTAPPNGQFFSLDARPMSIGSVAICGYAAGALDSTRQHCDIDSIRNVSADLETADYNASTEHGTSGAPVFYSLARDGQAPEIGVVGVHVTSKSVSGTAADDRRYNLMCRLTDAKCRWIRGV